MVSLQESGLEISTADRSLLEEIDEKYHVVREHPEFYLKRLNRVDKSLKNLADVYSWWLANEDLRPTLYSEAGVSTSREVKALSKAGIQNIRAGWAFLRGATTATGRKTPGVLTPGLLRNLAFYIDSKNTDFRSPNERADLFEDSYSSPHGSQIPPMIEEVISKLRKSRKHPINKAVYAHLSMVAIQPFTKGNKRLGRMLQDSILYDSDILPAVVQPGEKEVYATSLESGVLGLARDDLKAQRPFYNFVASKVNLALDDVLNDLDPFTRRKR